MENHIQKFKQNSIVFEKPGLLLKHLKLLRALSTTELNIFSWNLAHVSDLTISTKGCSGVFFFFFLDLEFFGKIKKDLVSAHSISKQNKKNPEHTFVNIIK